MIEHTLLSLARDIDTLTPDPDNARVHSDNNLEAIKSSLSRFGQQRPIVARADGVVIAGNATLRAAKALGWAEVAVTVFTGTEDESKAYAITDNRTAELAAWDLDVLGLQLADLSSSFDLDGLGWQAGDLGSVDLDVSEIEDSVFSGVASGLPIKVTTEQRETIDRAVSYVRRDVGDSGLSEGRALELICGDYMAGVDYEG